MEKDIEFTKNKQTKKEKKQTDCINKCITENTYWLAQKLDNS